MVYALLRTIATLIYHLVGSRRKLTLENLGIVFPGKSLAERKKMAKQSYANFAESMAFNILMITDRISNQELLDSIEVEGWTNYEEAQKLTKGKGLLIFSAHIGNWELLPQYAALRLEKPLHIIARETSNPLLEDRIVRPLRERFGVEVFHKKNALMRIVKVIKKGEYAGFQIDQKLKPRGGGIMIDFFGREAPTLASPALLQVRFGITVLPAFMVKPENGKHLLIIGKPIQWEDNGKSREEQIIELTRIHQKVIEDIILEYPEQWFWMHNRWGLPEGK
jgi:KDO2-lipid IV(A) lauroyltransferase